LSTLNNSAETGETIPSSTDLPNKAAPQPGQCASNSAGAAMEVDCSPSKDVDGAKAAEVKDATDGETSCPSTSADDDEKAPLQSVYHIKWIRFRGAKVAIITQNENGPCPLLAIMNVLLLQGKIKLPPMVQMIAASQLMEYLADCIFENAPKVSQK